MDDLAHGDAFELWGAFEGAKTAGVIIERFQSLAFEGKPIEAGEVYVVGVLPEFRGRGVATAPRRACPLRLLRAWSCLGHAHSLLGSLLSLPRIRTGRQKPYPGGAGERLQGIGSSLVARQPCCDEDLVEMRGLYRRFALCHSLCDMRPDAEWAMRGTDEY